MQEYTIPLILRGNVIEDNLVNYGGRRGELTFNSPDVEKYASDIPLSNPSDISDLYDISNDENDAQRRSLILVEQSLSDS